MTPAALRAMPSFAQHAWRATWLATRMVEPPPVVEGKAKAVPRRVIAERILKLFETRACWKLSEVKRELPGLAAESVSAAMQWLVDTKQITRVGHGIYERAAGDTAGEQRRQRPTPPGLRPRQ